ncbi:MAG TPA: hypothetical protein VD813_11570 [Pseudonocardia sp.]|nr:hypothetical protein [Pseudonocardia sp.]
MRRQVWQVLGAVLAVGALIGGCAGPNQAGAAVIVGSDVVPLEDVQRQIQVALSPEKAEALARREAASPAGASYGDREAIREVVTRAVRSELLARAAAEEGITVTESDVDAEIAARGGPEAVEQSSLFTLADERRNIRDDLVAAELGRRNIDRISVRFDLTFAADEAEARRKEAVIAAGGPEADALFTTPPSQAGRVVDATTGPALLAIVGGTEAGQMLVLRPQQDGQPWTLVRITERRTDRPAPPPAESAATNAGDDLLQLLGIQLLKPLAQEVGVRPNPRYGVWDPIDMAVVEESAVTGELVPVSVT